MTEKNYIQDKQGRSFKTLRVSLTDVCNLACLYCVKEGEEKRSIPGKKKLQFDDFIAVVKSIHRLTGLETVRLTGGEPLLYKDLVRLITALKEAGIPEVKMTTNGIFLKEKARDLKLAGLDSLNVSLDSVEESSFRTMSRRDHLQQTIYGIEEAIKQDLNLKLNSVIMKGMNDDQILPLLEFAGERMITIRYLELMKMGHLYKDHSKYFFSQDDMLAIIQSKHIVTDLVRNSGATANYWHTEEGRIFGIIANTSHPFCHDCTRLRLDSYGNIYGCLSNPFGISIMDAIGSVEEMEVKLRLALGQKNTVFSGSEMSMKAIGG